MILNFKVYSLDDDDNNSTASNLSAPEILEEPEEIKKDEIEELTEEVPLSKEQDYFSMTTFAQESRFYGTDLPSAESSQTIVENNGVYSITNNIEYSDVVQDPAFKALVDSVLHL